MTGHTSNTGPSTAAVPGDRTYLDSLRDNGSFGDVLDFAYELLDRLERATATATATDEPTSGETAHDATLRERLHTWTTEQMDALPEQRTPVAHGKAEVLAALRHELDQPSTRAGTRR